MTRTVAASAPIPLTRAVPSGVYVTRCDVCGRDWSPRCPNATPPAWDPTRGTTAVDWRPVRSAR